MHKSCIVPWDSPESLQLMGCRWWVALQLPERIFGLPGIQDPPGGDPRAAGIGAMGAMAINPTGADRARLAVAGALGVGVADPAHHDQP